MKRGWIAFLLFATGCGSASQDQRTVQISIPTGSSVTAVSDTLVAHGLLSSPGWFRWYARLTRRNNAIKAGVYEIRPGRSVPQLLRLLAEGHAAMRRLVVPEGLMLTEVANAVFQQLGIPADQFATAAHDPSLTTRLKDPLPSLDGYLYPSTYFVRYGATAAEVVAQMTAEFEAHWHPEWDARLDTLKLNRHQLLTLASIVEGEVRYGPDRPYVASVYYNRLRRHMRLQADPTVIYALGRRRRLFERDYLYRSPYNTYLIDGLPPGPIGQPSEETIKATLYPAATDFLFLVAQADGKHVFSRTLNEHLAAVQTVRKASQAPRPPAHE